MGLVTAGLPALALAQGNVFRDAGAKIRGDAYWPSRATTRYLEGARGYAQDFQTYVTTNPNPEPSVVKEVNLELSRYLSESKKHLAAMKKDFAADKATVAAIEDIEKELAAAVESQKAMIECCENEKFDKIAGMACCKDLVKQLNKVHEDHQNLMQRLSAKPAAPAATKSKSPAPAKK
jgi:transcriptional regulator with GAF, ATPase, and Fis domain